MKRMGAPEESGWQVQANGHNVQQDPGYNDHVNAQHKSALKGNEQDK